MRDKDAMTRILITGAAGEIGAYRPEDNAEDYLPELKEPAPDPNDPAVVFHGGAFCGLEFGGDIARID